MAADKQIVHRFDTCDRCGRTSFPLLTYNRYRFGKTGPSLTNTAEVCLPCCGAMAQEEIRSMSKSVSA